MNTKPPTFSIERTSQRGQSLLQWYDVGSRKIGALHSLQMPTEVAEYIVGMQTTLQGVARDMASDLLASNGDMTMEEYRTVVIDPLLPAPAATAAIPA